MYRKRYEITFLHHDIVRTKAIVEAENDIAALSLAFQQLIVEKWNNEGDFSWATSGEFKVEIIGSII